MFWKWDIAKMVLSRHYANYGPLVQILQRETEKKVPTRSELGVLLLHSLGRLFVAILVQDQAFRRTLIG